MTHAKLSPSGAARWMSCPASVALSAGCPDTAGGDAHYGTIAHHLAAKCLTQQKDASIYSGWQAHLSSDEKVLLSPEEASGEWLYAHEVDEDMIEMIQFYLDYVNDLVKATGGTLYVETAVPIDHLTGETGAEGTADVIILAGEELIVVDLKTGRVVVNAKGNKQGMMYASGALRLFGMTEDFRQVRMVIVQPNVSRAPDEWDFSIEDLHTFEAHVKTAVKEVVRIEKGEAPAVGVPSEIACEYCAARPCEAMDNYVKEATGVEFDSVGTALDKVPVVEQWIKAKFKQGFDLLKQGQPVVGAEGAYKLVEGRKGNRKWANAEEAEAVMRTAKLKHDVMFTYKLASPTSIEKHLKDRPRVLDKLMGMVVRVEGALTMAPASDKRPAVDVTPIADQFDDLA